MNVVVNSEATVKHLRNLLVFFRDTDFVLNGHDGSIKMNGMKIVLIAESFKHLLEVSNQIEKDLTQQAED